MSAHTCASGHPLNQNSLRRSVHASLKYRGRERGKTPIFIRLRRNSHPNTHRPFCCVKLIQSPPRHASLICTPILILSSYLFQVITKGFFLQVISIKTWHTLCTFLFDFRTALLFGNERVFSVSSDGITYEA